MKQRIEKLAQWIDSQSLRERGLILFAIIFSIFLLWEKILLDPLAAQAEQLKVEVKKQNKTLAQVREQQVQTLTRAGSDPDAKTLKDIASLQVAMQSLNERLQQMTVNLIEPAKMAGVLEDVLTRETDLKLIRVEALPPKPLGNSESSDEGDDKRIKSALPGVYQHTLQIEFQGSYLSTLDYMQELEKLSQQFYWGSVDFTIKEHPKAHVIITIKTLSLNEAWIGV